MEGQFSVIHAYRTQATMKDYPGRMAVLFFTAGCNFRCGFCHNSGLFDAVKSYSWEELGEICRHFRKLWVSAATISGGEPTIHPELPETIRFIKNQGFAVKLDTNGSNPEMLEQIIGQVDYVAMDLKCSLDNYPALTGYKEIGNLRRSIAIIKEKARDYEFRTTLIETLHSDVELVEGIKAVAGAKRVVLQPFVPHEDLPAEEMRTLPRTRPSFMEHARETIKDYVENVEIRGGL